jgi:ribosomal RNA-processing protein 7
VVESIKLGREAAGDVLEKAVKGSLENEESDEDDDEDEVEEEDDEKEGLGLGLGEGAQFISNNKGGLSKSARRRQKRNKGLPPSIPSVTPLPSLNPREQGYGTSGNHIAYITYLDQISLTKAMSYSGSAISLKKYNTEPTGLQYYTSLHSTLRPSHVDVKAFADSSMERYDRLQSLLLSSRARQKGAGALVDEDGFTVVVRGGRYGRTGGRGDEGKGSSGVGVAKRGLAPKELKGGAAELTDFYKFQKVDRKRKGEFLFSLVGMFTDTVQNWQTFDSNLTTIKPKSKNSRNPSDSSRTRSCFSLVQGAEDLSFNCLLDWTSPVPCMCVCM